MSHLEDVLSCSFFRGVFVVQRLMSPTLPPGPRARCISIAAKTPYSTMDGFFLCALPPSRPHTPDLLKVRSVADGEYVVSFPILSAQTDTIRKGLVRGRAYEGVGESWVLIQTINHCSSGSCCCEKSKRLLTIFEMVTNAEAPGPPSVSSVLAAPILSVHGCPPRTPLLGASQHRSRGTVPFWILFYRKLRFYEIPAWYSH